MPRCNYTEMTRASQPSRIDSEDIDAEQSIEPLQCNHATRLAG